MIIEQTNKARKKSYGASSFSNNMLSSTAAQTGSAFSSYLSGIVNPADVGNRMIADSFEINTGTVVRNLKVYKVVDQIEAILFGSSSSPETLQLQVKGIAFKYSDLQNYMMKIARVADKVVSAQCSLYPFRIEDGKSLDDGETDTMSYGNSVYPMSLAGYVGSINTLRLNDDDIFIVETGGSVQSYMEDSGEYFTVDNYWTNASRTWFSLTDAPEPLVIFPKKGASVEIDAIDWIDLKLDLGYIMLDAAVKDGIYSLADVIETNYR